MSPWPLIVSVCGVGALGCEQSAPAPVSPSALPIQAPVPPIVPTPAAAAHVPVYLMEGAVGVTLPKVLWTAGGLEFSTQEWKIGERTGRIWRVRVGEGGRLEVVPSGEVKMLGEFVPKGVPSGEPYVMINGGFYERIPDSQGFRPMGVVRTGGKTHQAHRVRGGSGVLMYQAGKGTDLVHRKVWQGLKEQPSEALQSIDRLVDKGVSLVNPNPNARLAARSAIALSPQGTWFVVAASHQSIRPVAGGVALAKTGYTGLKLGEFAQYLVEELGAEKALNMDGSVSAQMRVWHAKEGRGFEVRGERGTINAVVGY